MKTPAKYYQSRGFQQNPFRSYNTMNHTNYKVLVVIASDPVLSRLYRRVRQIVNRVTKWVGSYSYHSQNNQSDVLHRSFPGNGLVFDLASPLRPGQHAMFAAKTLVSKLF